MQEILTTTSRLALLGALLIAPAVARAQPAGEDAEAGAVEEREGAEPPADDAEGAEPAPNPLNTTPAPTRPPAEPLASSPFNQKPKTRQEPSGASAVAAAAATAQGGVEGDIASKLDIEGFLATDIVTASRQEQDLLDVPASVVVITAEDIERRGYTDLSQVIRDVPGFDISLVNGTQYMLAYQRGYRTPWTQRTLLMVDGKVDNHLWTHQAAISRQYPLSNIERIEILYGPAAAVYGPNAFLGVINIITKDASALERDGVAADLRAFAGSWNSRGYDMSVRARRGELSLSVTARLFRSDEPDLSGQGPWLQSEQYANEQHWRPLLPHGNVENPDYNPGIENSNVPLGQYYDPTDNYGLQAKLKYRNLELGVLGWERKEAYGPYYAADHVQNNSFWSLISTQVWGQHTQPLSEDLELETFLSWRRSDIRGNWAEATPDWCEGREEYSYVSFTDWHSDNNSALFKELLRWKGSENFQVSGGFKYERKNLTKAYAIHGYWDSFSTSLNADEQGPEGFGAAIYHSSRDGYQTSAENAEEMPAENMVLTDDIGGFVQTTLNWDALAFNFGLRHDVNSIYGASTNPRMAAIFKWSSLVPAVDAAALKLIYGTAFLSARRLYLANPLRNPARPDGERVLKGYPLVNFHTNAKYGPARLGWGFATCSTSSTSIWAPRGPGPETIRRRRAPPGSRTRWSPHPVARSG